MLESVYQEAASSSSRFAASHSRVGFVGAWCTGSATTVGDAKLDLIVGEQLVVELKATEGLAPVHFTQVLSYLKLTGFRLELLINFNVRGLVPASDVSFETLKVCWRSWRFTFSSLSVAQGIHSGVIANWMLSAEVSALPTD